MRIDPFDVIKYGSVIFSACYGLYATVTDFHVERDGRKLLSKAGYIGVCLLGFTSLLSLTTDYLKDQRDDRDKREASQKAAEDQKKLSESLATQLNKTEAITNTLGTQQQTTQDLLQRMRLSVSLQQQTTDVASSILHQTERTLEPLRELTFSAEIVLPSDNPDVTKYMENLDAKVKTIKPVPGVTVSVPDFLVRFRNDGEVDDVYVDEASAHLDFPSLSDVFANIEVLFLKSSTNRFQDGPVLSVFLDNDTRSSRVVYRVAGHKLIIEYTVKSDPSKWRNTGFLSLVDIRNGFVTFNANPNMGTADRGKRNLAIVRGAWFKSFGLSAAGGFAYQANRIYRLKQDQNGIPAFGGSFAQLFESKDLAVYFVDEYDPTLEVQDKLDAAISEFEKQMVGYGFRLSVERPNVRIGGRNDEDKCDLDDSVLVLPPDFETMRACLILKAAHNMLSTDRELSYELPFYFAADFMQTPQLFFPGATVDLSHPGSKDADPDLRLSSSLWELRKSVGSKFTNTLVASALQKWKPVSTEADASTGFGHLLEDNVNGRVASQLRSILRRHGVLP